MGVLLRIRDHPPPSYYTDHWPAKELVKRDWWPESVCRCRYLHENRRYCRLIQQYGVVPKRCLELFARSLMPYTVSVGYEALLLQSELCFISTDEESEA
ncbi:hypothetical protein COOONC_09745 [Cooperia oncophora]